MSNRRVKVSSQRKEGEKIIAEIEGVAGENYISEIYQPYGVSANPANGQSVTIEQNGDPDNYVTLPAGGYELAEKETTVLYHGDTKIIIKADGDIEILGSGKLTTEMDIVSGGVSLQGHTHGGVERGFGSTSGPI